MKKIFLYILAAAGVLFSCQKPEILKDEQMTEPGSGVYGEVPVTFSALLPATPQSKAMSDDPDDDIKSMHLVLFDENGMLVETREATILEAKEHDGHNDERLFEVTLTVTDQPRIIHFIANCPVDQIAYGHEASIIGNLYVAKGKTIETAYWARSEVPYILVDEMTNDDGSISYRPTSSIIGKFQCVPMLRNYAQVTVMDNTGDTDPFVLTGFTIYNTIDIGTVAPYNNKNQSFQSFIDASGVKYSYPDLSSLTYPYEGHALASAELNTELEKDASSSDGYKWYEPNGSFYMYERKISAKTNEEDKWKESPPHVIVKGTYNGTVNYYKVDLVYNVMEKDENGNETDVVSDIKYYNILRNFRYQFTISQVAGEGYKTVEEAVLGATSNNLSGSSTTAKFTNISDNTGRLWVSYTDTTLVSSNTITLKYKYIPDLETGTVDNSHVTLEDISGGEVISGHEIAGSDITTGEWAGYREVTLTINEPSNTTKEQTVVVKTNSANLKRDVRYYLKQKYTLEVECTPEVAAEIGASVQVDIKLPLGLTEDMFPLDLAIEVYDMSLSPDASQNTLPVESGISVIPVAEKEGKTTFHYIKTIESKADYDALTTEGNHKILSTYWYTNKADNASTVYVVNKYFNPASDDFINPLSFNGEFSKSSLGIDEIETVEYIFDIHEYVEGMVVTVTLGRLAPVESGSGLVATSTAGVYTYTPTAAGTQTIYLQTTETTEGTCSVTIDADDAYGYMAETDEIQQSDAIVYSGTSTITFNNVDRPQISGGGGGNNSYSAEINSISVDGATVEYEGSAAYTYNQNSGTLTVTLSSVTITGATLTEDTEVTINVTITRTRNNTTATSTKSLTTTIGNMSLTLQ